jgi:hypothetical protein
MSPQYDLPVIDLDQPLERWSDLYDNHPALKGIWTKASFAQHLKIQRDFYGDAIQSYRSGLFINKEKFAAKFSEWQSAPRPNNLDPINLARAESAFE